MVRGNTIEHDRDDHARRGRAGRKAGPTRRRRLSRLARGRSRLPAALRQSLPDAPAATIQRTFVSTSGSDANLCTATAPCRNFAAAIANTTAGGEVVALTSGGDGPFTVSKAITIAGAPGEHVAVTAFAGTAVYVNAGAEDTVVLRNLYLTGLGARHGHLA